MNKEEKTPTREEDLARLNEIRDAPPATTWKGALDYSKELDEIMLRAIEWWNDENLSD